ncbi:hypothetical protein N665_0257s0040 [Sinapis alba]|nr:hypothetical protein N665_0257s0040 [Sinapis alba]
MASSSKPSWSLSTLPHEIIQEIFYKTPAEALVRSKPTCKEWYALITNKRFIYQHLRRRRSQEERFIRIFDTVQIMEPVTRTRSVSPIPNEFHPPYKIDTMVHCDGLMLCKCADLMSLSYGNLAVWNPTTRKIKWIEPAEIITSNDYNGIGYNSDGYKIVRFTFGMFEFKGLLVPHVEIYEFNTSSWRTIGGKVDVDVNVTYKCVAVMGNMYWVAYRVQSPQEDFIWSFDFSDETFKDICFCPTSYVNSHLGCFNGDSLSMLQQDQASRQIEVWVSSKLSDGDVSFSKYFSLSGPDLPALRVHADAARPVYCFVKPKSVIVWCVGVEREGDKVCSCCTLYEIDENGVKSKRETERDNVLDYSRAFVCGYVYVPSLIPLP